MAPDYLFYDRLIWLGVVATLIGTYFYTRREIQAIQEIVEQQTQARQQANAEARKPLEDGIPLPTLRTLTTHPSPDIRHTTSRIILTRYVADPHLLPSLCDAATLSSSPTTTTSPSVRAQAWDEWLSLLRAANNLYVPDVARKLEEAMMNATGCGEMMEGYAIDWDEIRAIYVENGGGGSNAGHSDNAGSNTRSGAGEMALEPGGVPGIDIVPISARTTRSMSQREEGVPGFIIDGQLYVEATPPLRPVEAPYPGEEDHFLGLERGS